MPTARDRLAALRRRGRAQGVPSDLDGAPAGLDTRGSFARELARLGDAGAVAVVRVTVPESPRGTDDDLHEAMLAFAAHLHGRLVAGDHAAQLEEDEFGVLLRRPGAAACEFATGLRRAWERLHPQVAVHIGVAAFRGSGTDTLRAAYDALDVELAADDGPDGGDPVARWE